MPTQTLSIRTGLALATEESETSIDSSTSDQLMSSL